MVQFKNVFTGLEKRPYSRAATAQKCVRAGGKHNDLDNVGYTARHHTFFEMLGNFSFGDYFKERAIELAWNLITKEFGLAQGQAAGHRLSHRRRGGRPLEEDRRLARRPHHPHRDLGQFLGDGRHRPVRPVLGDLLRPRRAHSGAARPAARTRMATASSRSGTSSSCSIEQVTKEERIDLPRPSIDTGMGLERIAAVLQGEHDNYDIDLFRALIRASEEATGVKAEGKNRASHRVIADHLRASCFLIADGVLPSNEGRGYVLRRIMRRAMRHAQLLGADEPLMWRLVPALVREMGQAYPELVRGEALITETLKLEETRFRKTLARGLGLLADATDTLSARRPARRRDGLQALRHLRLPARPDAGCAAPARHRGRYSTASTRRWSGRRPRRAPAGPAPARRRPRRSGSRVREKTGATEFLGYDTEKAEGVVAGAGHGRQGRRRSRARARRSASSSTRRRSTASPAARWATPARSPAKVSASTVTDTQKKADGLFVHVGKVAEGHGEDRRGGRARRSITPAARGCAPTIRRRICCTRRCARCSAPMSRRRARWSRRSGCASTSRIPSRSRPRSSSRSRSMANEIVVQNSPVTTRLMSRRRRHRRRRDGAVRRKIRRRGARRVDGHGDCTATRPASPIRSSCAAAPMSAPPATSAWCASSRRKRGRGRRAPHRGADRRGGAPPSRRAGQAAEGGRRDAEGRRRPTCWRASRRCSTSAASWSAN